MLLCVCAGWTTRETRTCKRIPSQPAPRNDSNLYERANTDGNSISSDYIYLSKPVYVTHSAGKYAAKRFRKASCPIIERLTNSLMMHGRNNGKKLMAVRIVDHAFEIVSVQPPKPSPLHTKKIRSDTRDKTECNNELHSEWTECASVGNQTPKGPIANRQIF